MPYQGLVAWGAKSWAALRGSLCLALLLSLLTAACGSEEGQKRAVECLTADDCDDALLGVCDTVTCEQNSCVVGSLPDGQKCNDEDPLTRADACLTGVCKGVLKVCDDDDLGPCLKAVHDPETDECVVEPVDDGSMCDDENACTQGDECQAGECVGGEPVTCAAHDDCHEDGECDPETGECSEVVAEDGAPCDDGKSCTSADTCLSGSCAGEAVVCDDGLSCSADACDEESGACEADMSQCSCEQDADCSDGNACNGVEVCNTETKLCQLGEPVVCAQNPDPCLNDLCVPETGACEPAPTVDGAECDDGNACTTHDRCEDGVCGGGDEVVCAALSQCHAPGTCDPATGACSNPEKADDSACNDGDACSATDTCQAGSCVGSTPVACRASDQCHDSGVCNTKTGSCSNPLKQNGVACDDGSRCTLGDACQDGACKPAGNVACAAADSCHLAGTCDSATGNCTSPLKPNGSSCSDGLSCTGSDVCNNGKCGGTAVACDDGIACTKDSCSEAQSGCTSDASACPCDTSADCDDKNPCNGVEVCDLGSLKCVVGKPVDCSALDSDCSVGACDGTGKCMAVPKADGLACNDGNLCTGTSSCQAGKCVGQNPITCAASDQCHAAGTCNPSTGVCSNPLKANGSACTDGSACTAVDSCQGGVCVGASPVTCPASDACHNAASCNPSTGKCDATPKPNGTACSDGNACTQTDTCQGGVCSGSNPVTCAASDQCHSAGSCDASTGKCTNPSKSDGTACNDGSVCTQADTCQKGTCTGTKPLTCTASDQCHSAGSCDPVKGCSNPAKSDGAACNDGNACTKTDACTAGVCKGTSPVTCTASDQCHDVGTCNPSSGVCSNPNKPNDTPCSDGKACSGNDKCTNGVCGGAAVACDDKIACTVDSCVEPGGCDFDHGKCQCQKDADCDDGDACTGVETCNLATLTCVSGKKVSCANLDDTCNVGACDSKTGACSAKPRPDGTSCTDGDSCTRTDGCVAGKCVGKNPVTCAALDQCHDVGSCDKATGACSNPNKPNGATCNDGNKCSTGDSCQAGVCAGAAVVCAASDQCHLAGTCDATSGLCTNPLKTGSCDDGNKCTQSDTCLAGVCTGTNPVVCSASDQCHAVGSCDVKTGVCSNPSKADGTACNDSSLCTQSDSCQAGKCTGTKPITCKALDDCHAVGTCDPLSGNCSNPFASAGTACKDASACTTGETCDGSGNCRGGSAVVCTTTAACKVATCDATLGCEVGNQPNGNACDDDSQCTQTDQCRAGQCVGTNKRTNARGDWADDPGTIPVAGKPWTSLGPRSVDTFSDAKGNVHLVGTYSGTIAFNDKDSATGGYQTLALPKAQGTGIYWAVYDETGKLVSLANLGGSSARGALSVAHAAGNKDGSFTVLGTFTVAAMFGLNGKTKDLLDKPLEVFIARYSKSGDIEWLAQAAPDKGAPVVPASVANFDDGSIIAIGQVDAPLSFLDANDKPFGAVQKPGVWAVELDPKGGGRWARTVVFPSGTVTARAVTTHEDGRASLTGGFTGDAALGPNGEVPVSVGTAEKGRDIWFQNLDEKGNIKWGGRVGGEGADVPGDVARVKGGGLLLLANTLGATPNASDAKTNQQLYASGSGLQTHVLGLDADGVLQSDGLIGNTLRQATQGYQLKLDANGAYALAGTFALNTSFWSSVGFGAGAPSGAADFTVKSAATTVGPQTLFLARVDAKSAFDWGVQAGGDNSGMTTAPWSIVLAAHPSHSATVAGIFNAPAVFGDQVTENLTAAPDSVGNAFVVHLNSEAEYDYCP